MQEIENPELATKRTRILYKLKGYSDGWIEKRMRGIVIREEFTDEWQQRGAQAERDYEILNAEIFKATFGVTPKEYKKLKGLKRQNLRDHMDEFGLILICSESVLLRKFIELRIQRGRKVKERCKAGRRRGGNCEKAVRKRTEATHSHKAKLSQKQ